MNNYQYNLQTHSFDVHPFLYIFETMLWGFKSMPNPTAYKKKGWASCAAWFHSHMKLCKSQNVNPSINHPRTCYKQAL